MRKGTRRFLRSERGTTAIEYALIAGFLSIAIAVVVGNLGSGLANLLTGVMDGF